MANLGNRATYDKACAELRAYVAQGQTVEILNGPCAPLTIKTEADVRVYAHRLWAWLTEGT